MVYAQVHWELLGQSTESGLEVIKLEYSLKLKIKRNDCSQSLRFILSLRMNSSFKTLGLISDVQHGASLII